MNPAERSTSAVAESVGEGLVHSVRGPLDAGALGTTLVHEHVLVDFGGAATASRSRYDAEAVFQTVLPQLQELARRGCRTLFECTPAYLGRDPQLLRRLADHAIARIRLLHAMAPDKPWLQYYAPGTSHAPHHAPKEWIAKFKGQFDQGWDKVREETLARQKEMGIVPANTKLTPRPKEIQAWDSLDFRGSIESRRTGNAAWQPREACHLYGFALWWECTLAPGVVLTTSPHAPRTHWDQIYLPLLQSISAEPGDDVALSIETETGGAETGIEVRWSAHHTRDGRALDEQTLSIAAGWLA